MGGVEFRFHAGFLDFMLDFWISCWISGFRVNWISELQPGFLISEHESLCQPGSFIFNRVMECVGVTVRS